MDVTSDSILNRGSSQTAAMKPVHQMGSLWGNDDGDRGDTDREDSVPSVSDLCQEQGTDQQQASLQPYQQKDSFVEQEPDLQQFHPLRDKQHQFERQTFKYDLPFDQPFEQKPLEQSVERYKQSQQYFQRETFEYHQPFESSKQLLQNKMA